MDYLLVLVVIALVFLILRATVFSNVATVDVVKDIDENGKTQAEEEDTGPTVIQDYTPRILSNYNGYDLEKVFIGVRGNVYDVSSGRRFYGPSGPYSNFAGHDASRGLAKNSFELDVIPGWDEPLDDLADLTDADWDTLRNWENLFKSKYPVVGHLVSEKDFQASQKKAEVMD